MVPLGGPQTEPIYMGHSWMANACVQCSTNSTNGIPISFKVLPMVHLVISLVPMVMPMVPLALPMVALVPLVKLLLVHW